MKLFLTFLVVAAVFADASTMRIQTAADLPAKCSSLVQEHGISVVKFLANLDPKKVPDLGVLCEVSQKDGFTKNEKHSWCDTSRGTQLWPTDLSWCVLCHRSLAVQLKLRPSNQPLW